MIIVIPVSSHDAHLIPSFSKAVRHFGANSRHEAIIVARPSASDHANALLEALDGLFGKLEVQLLDQEGPSGWPQGPNHYWNATIAHLQFARKNTKPWLWMELDTTPLAEGWADKLETEYNLAKMPVMGVVVKTHATDKDGNEVDAGKHTVGVAIYPPDFSRYSQLWAYVPKMPTPFDVVCQWEIVPLTHQTGLMQHGFRTQNYRRTPEGIRGEDNNNFPLGIRFDQPVREGVVLFHGCDDGSLAELVASDKTAATAPAKITDGIDPDVLAPNKRKVKLAA